MALWLFRAGKFGELEKTFLDEGCVYLTWEGLDVDISKLSDKSQLTDALQERFPDQSKNAIRNWVGQTWPVGKEIMKGDWLILPSKLNSVIHIGEVTGPYKFIPGATESRYHQLPVKWFATDIPRKTFDQDLLYSFGAFMTVCRIRRNNAEQRIKDLAKNNFNKAKIPLSKGAQQITDSLDDNNFPVNIEELAYDGITQFIEQKMAGHALTHLISAILSAKGYTVFVSPPGPDKGVDILAGPEPFGFGHPRICVQVKSGDIQADSPTLNQLIGTMKNHNADQGILVSWNGFKNSVVSAKASQFFNVRLWSSKEILEQLFSVYDKLPGEIQATLPLKRIWCLASGD
jgi:restriction system protein